jgi:hypothetical protein
MDNRFKKTEGMAAKEESDSYPGIASAMPLNSVGEDVYSRWAQAATVAKADISRLLISMPSRLPLFEPQDNFFSRLRE